VKDLDVLLITVNDCKVSNWAYGKTYEYYIFPCDSNYKERDFYIRLSMATQETEEISEYTNLEGFTRFLTMLENDAHLSHSSSGEKILHELSDIDVFDGGEKTFAKGRVTDFNMMLKNGIKGDMAYIRADGLIKPEYKSIALLSINGKASIKYKDNFLRFSNKYDMIVLKEVDSNLNLQIDLNGDILLRMDFDV
jgi:environmental stress-induced protein Ves